MTSSQSRIRIVCGALLGSSLWAIVPLQRTIEAQPRGVGNRDASSYVPSEKSLRLMAMGHQGLLADIYWTRAVQYYGRARMEGATRFDALGPLLYTATELDPQLVIAYRFGAVFLAEKPPAGAGRPEEALQLLRRGIVANPRQWRLWQDVGFIYYWDLRDYRRAAAAFRAGGDQPGAYVWMKALAASVELRGGDLANSRLLWSEIYSEAPNEQIRRTAEDHLVALQAQQELNELNALLENYERQSGRKARSFRELVGAGLLNSVPRDPSDSAYSVSPNGQAVLGPGSRIDLRLLQ